MSEELKERIAEALQKLTERVEDITFEDDMDLFHYIMLSSRMKALGQDKYYSMIPKILSQEQFQGRLDEILEFYCRMEFFDLDARDGEWVVPVIIEAQDLYCFHKFSKDKGWYKFMTGKYIEQLVEETGLKALDTEACSLLRDWLDTYPVPEDLCIPVVAVPLSDWDYALAAKLDSMIPRKVIHGTWTKKTE